MRFSLALKVRTAILGLAVGYAALLLQSPADSAAGPRPHALLPCCRKCQEGAGWSRCGPPEADAEGRIPGFERELLSLQLRKADRKPAPALKGGRVAAMVEQALVDQVALLEEREAELKEWDRPAQARFLRWFGTTDQRARQLIFQRIQVLYKLNDAFTVRNFRRAVRSRQGVFAFVFPNDPSRIFLDRAFVRAPATGVNSRAGTIAHEMSHFVIAGGTRDHAYGTARCRALARRAPRLALTNADNFEFYVEGAD